VSVVTCHNDNSRTGLNPNENVLTPQNVNSNGFGKIFSKPVDGPIYAQPLYLSRITIPGKGIHNVVYVATQHDSVYAFDADSNAGSNAPPLWHVSFINPAAGITAVPTTDAVDFPYQDCRTFVGEIGIVGTPVIDTNSGTLYVVARTKEPLPPPNNQTLAQVQRLHALDVATGAERRNSPVVIDATVLGTGIDNNGGQVRFNPAREMQRAGLLLAGGVVYVAFASYCDFDPYHGWIMGYNAQTLQQVGAFNTSPNSTRGGIWMGGAGLAADTNGSIYCVTGNGTFDTSPNPQSFGDSFLRLTLTTNLVVADYFTPYDQGSMDSADEDLGPGGTLLLPSSVGSGTHPDLILGCSKLGKIYLLDRANLGHFNPVSDSQIVQEMTFYTSQSSSPHFFGMPAFFNNRLYLQGVGEFLKSYTIANAQILPTALSQATETLGFRGATPSISASGITNGVVWQLAPTASVNPSLRAYNAEDLSQKIYDSYLSSNIGLPDVLTFVKFVIPTIANGKVYLGTTDSLAVFGLRAIFKSVSFDRAASTMHLSWIGPVGSPNIVQKSEDLVHWSDLGPGIITTPGNFTYADPLVPGNPTRFYRLR
jgi:hypothetical protein